MAFLVITKLFTCAKTARTEVYAIEAVVAGGVGAFNANGVSEVDTTRIAMVLLGGFNYG